MNEICARITAHTTVLQLQCGLPDFTETDAGNKEVDRLPFDMQTMASGPTAPLDQDGVVFGRPIAGDDMDLPFPAQGLLNQIDMLDHPGIHRGYFAGMMTTKDVIEIV